MPELQTPESRLESPLERQRTALPLVDLASRNVSCQIAKMLLIPSLASKVIRFLSMSGRVFFGDALYTPHRNFNGLVIEV